MDTSEKIKQLESLVASDPEDADLYFLLGKALLDARRFDEAAQRLAEAALRKPDLAAIRRFWGEALRGKGDAAGARDVWTKGIMIAERTGDLQAGKEMKALMKKLNPERTD